MKMEDVRTLARKILKPGAVWDREEFEKAEKKMSYNPDQLRYWAAVFSDVLDLRREEGGEPDFKADHEDYNLFYETVGLAAGLRTYTKEESSKIAASGYTWKPDDAEFMKFAHDDRLDEARKILRPDFTWDINAFNEAATNLKKPGELDFWADVFDNVIDIWDDRPVRNADDEHFLKAAKLYAAGLCRELRKAQPQIFPEDEEDDLPF